MNKNYQNYLYVFVSALTIGAGSYICSTDVLADADNAITQVANTNSQSDNQTTVKQAALDTPSVQVNPQQVADETSNGQIEDVKYSIDDGTLTLSGGKLTSTHKYPWKGDETITNVRITGPLKLEGSAPASLFSWMENLKSIDGMDKIDTSKATDMSTMFMRDFSLTTLDLSSFDTSMVTDMSYMFSGFQSLTSLDISKFDTAKVTNMSYMFSAPGLTSLDVSNFDTSKVTDMSYMFTGTAGLTSLDVSKLDTSSVINMSGMFSWAGGLTSLDLSNFDTSKVRDMSWMYNQSTGLTHLDLSSFDTTNVINVEGMFNNDSNLSTLKLGSKAFNKGLDGSALPGHSSASAIPDSNPVRYATGPGWLAVDADNGGAVDNPQGKTVYDGYLTNRPAEMETYVWQQDAKPVAKQTVTVEYIDVATGKAIPGVKAKTITGFQGREYNVTGADSRPDINSYTWDGKIPTNAKGTYGDKAIVVQYVYNKNTMPSTPGTPNTPPTATGPSSPTSSSNVSSNSSNTSTNSSISTTSSSDDNVISIPNSAAAKGTVVYSIKKIGLYKTTDFTKNNRRSWYAKKPRINRPMFVVTGYARSANGNLRYQVRDVNHKSKTKGQTGYITASQKYIRFVYYATKQSMITVINPRGVNAYRKVNLTGKVKNYRQGTLLRVKGIVKHNLTTRYVLTNGDYITANRKLINMGRHKQVKSVKTKQAINRYSNVSLTKKNQSIAKNRMLKVYGYDYSRKNDISEHGTLRYRVAGGYITANTKYVRVYQ
ncbi:BspA family leucine-rich repeat surface protein [Lentilactobacillus hilgardii]|nr:BspA family leucine-rich repeat surface protein [Lentilactobacillus hilgardii]MCV3739957.1 BspA family leucine-rich repeat surface protein [Lentilactobacillus hilgardii]